jgi:phage tail protein X
MRIKSARHIFFLVVVLTISGHVQANTQLYVVKENDTITGILRALNYGETYSELKPFINEIVQTNPGIFANGNPDFVIPGSTITLPDNPNLPEPTSIPVPEPIAEPGPEPEPEPITKSMPIPDTPIIGNLQASTGRIEIRRDNETVTITGRKDLYAGDVIFTRESSLAEITLLDNTRILMGPESEFTISVFSFEESQSQGENAPGSLVASFRNGVIRAIPGLIGKFNESQFRIDSTLTATIEIRSTDFTARSCNQVEVCGDLYGVAVAVQDGSIGFKNDAAEIELNQNEFAQVQSTTDAPAKASLPEGFFDLQRDITGIQVPVSWWQKAIEYLKYLF